LSAGAATIEAEAQLALARLNDGLNRLKLGLLHLQPGDDVITVLLSSGTIRSQPTVQKSTTVGKLLDSYLEAIPKITIEDNSYGMLGTHIRNLKRHFGVRMVADQVELSTVQGFINSRGTDRGIRGGMLSPVTIKKEITTLYSAWAWAIESSIVSKTLPLKSRLRYGKQKQKPPFRTWEEIDRVIEKGKLNEVEQRAHFLLTCLHVYMLTRLSSGELVFQQTCWTAQKLY
jgi:hypothetical protein